jgi:hypothetical protein
MSGDLLRANTSHPVEPRLSRLSLPAQDLCNSKALPPIQEFLARMIGVHPPRSAGTCPGAHLFVLIMWLYNTARRGADGVRLFANFSCQ